MTLEELKKIFPDATAETWHQHPKGGGWVQNTAHVDASVTVEINAQVSGDARVYGDAQVYGDARVYGDAQVYGDARVSGDARVYGNALVYGNAQVYGDAWVYGDAQVYGDAWDESPLFLQGSKYSLSVCAHGTIAIGCQIKTVAEWKKDGAACAKKHRFSAKMIAEYKLLLNTAIAWMKLRKVDKPSAK